MWSKIYLILLGLSIAVMTFFTYYSWSWLQSPGNPADAVAGFEYHSNLAWMVLWLSAAALLMLGNSVLWVSGSAWAMWTTFLYFAVFVVVRSFWLNRSFLNFSSHQTGIDTSVSGAPLVAVILIVLAMIIVFFDKFLVVRLLAKTYPERQKTESEPPAE